MEEEKLLSREQVAEVVQFAQGLALADGAFFSPMMSNQILNNLNNKGVMPSYEKLVQALKTYKAFRAVFFYKYLKSFSGICLTWNTTACMLKVPGFCNLQNLCFTEHWSCKLNSYRHSAGFCISSRNRK